jgi:folate-binding protein YgfZ
MDGGVAEGIRALRERRAVVDLSDRGRVRVTGSGAGTFLGDLVTGPVERLEPGTATRSLLLTPTGRVRADFTVARLPGRWLLVQDREQPDPVGRLLAPYVLSADVTLEDADDEGPLVAVVSDVVPSSGRDRYSPGALGSGTDVLAVSAPDAAAETGAEVVSDEAAEAWRVLRGDPRLGADFDTDALPQEAGLEAAVDFAKGCFLGQEAVAKVRNLGRPPFVVLAARAYRDVTAGQSVRAGDRDVGRVTSAAADPAGGFGVIVRVRWEAHESDLASETGVSLRTS